MKVADEVWVVTALLHHENPRRPDFSVAEIVDRAAVEGLSAELRPGVQVHAALHCVANKRPNPANYRMLYETGRGRRRLFRMGDLAHPYRKGKITPSPDNIPEAYHYLFDWYRNDYGGASNE